MKEIYPTKQMYSSFRGLEQITKCEKCGRLLPKNKRKPRKKFWLIKELKKDMWKVKISDNKSSRIFNKNWFKNN